MQTPNQLNTTFRCSLAVALAAAVMSCVLPAVAQQPTAPKPKPATAKKPPAKKSTAAKKPSASKRPPMTKDQVQAHWRNQSQDLFLNELRLRGLTFEPEESWPMGLHAATGVPAASVPEMAAAIRNLVAPPPNPDDVAREAPALLAKLKEAAQKRSESEMAPLVHPALLLEKSRVYDLFDTANYRNHMLGKFSPQEYRRVGVQFFQLTTSQVERLHYVLFAMSRGKIVVRDVITGPEVARLFLQDEQKLALSKLDLVFRALNDGDEAALKLLFTPGLYDSLTQLAENAKAAGARVTRGLQMSQVSTKPSVPLDGKSIRVVVRVAYATRSGRKIEFDIDFERIDNDLKVVRLRDLQNRIIAWDPDIDNYLNRRFGLPDGPKLVDVARSDVILPLSMVREFFMRALEDRNAQKMREYADEFLESEATSGTGYGMRAAAHHVAGDYAEADKDATLAIQRGGTVYIPVLRHMLWQSKELWPVVLAISSEKIDYLPSSSGLAPEQIALDAITKVKIESGGRFGRRRPFLELDFQQVGANGKKDKKNYNFAAVGTMCPGEPNAPGRTQLIPFDGDTICSASGQTTILGRLPGGGNKTPPPPTLVPPAWKNDLNVVIRTLEVAQRQSSAGERASGN